jgi:hypothetical protein
MHVCNGHSALDVISADAFFRAVSVLAAGARNSHARVALFATRTGETL